MQLITPQLQGIPGRKCEDCHQSGLVTGVLATSGIDRHLWAKNRGCISLPSSLTVPSGRIACLPFMLALCIIFFTHDSRVPDSSPSAIWNSRNKYTLQGRVVSNLSFLHVIYRRFIIIPTIFQTWRRARAPPVLKSALCSSSSQRPLRLS